MFTEDLNNSSSPKFKSLASTIEKSLLPALKTNLPSVEAVRYAPKNMAKLYELIWRKSTEIHTRFFMLKFVTFLHTQIRKFSTY